jgi:outer membrane protein OmpA-like peptidoglycan-associated protein
MSTINQVGNNILFPANGSKIMGEKSLNAVAEIKAILDQNPQGVIVIQGHASVDGNEDYNQKLSVQRAESVRDKLLGLGVDAARLEVVGMGSSDPLNGDPSDRAGSRRVEFYKK